MRKLMAIALALTLLVAFALPTTVAAKSNKSNWDLEGWRPDAGKWMDGLLFTWSEGDEVPYRLKVRGYNGIDMNIAIQHDYLDADGHVGIDYVVLDPGEVFIGPRTNRTTAPGSIPGTHLLPVSQGGTYFDIVGEPPVEVPNGYVQQWEFQITPAGKAFLQTFEDGNWAFYWKAHLAVTGTPPPPYGSSYWNGASLHAHTSVTGNQDVPIKTPSQVTPPPLPDIDIIKEISVDGGVNWHDANDMPTNNTFPTWIPVGTEVLYRILVTNTGGVLIEGIVVTDSRYPGELGVYPSSLEPGDSFTIEFAIVAEDCEHENVAVVVGVAGTTPVGDVDNAWYKGY